MTTKTYSEDLRKRVIEYLDQNNDYKATSVTFKVSVSAIGRWYRKYKKDGHYEAKKRGGSQRRIDLERLADYVKSNPDMMLKEAAEEFKVSIFTISYWLRELGYSYKKKPLPMWKRVKRNEFVTQKL